MADPGQSRQPPRPRLRRLEAVVNAASGSVSAGAAEELERLVQDRGLSVRVANAQPKDIETAVRAAVAAGPDAVLVLAGDGTARLAAQLCGPDGPLVAPLPGGTMNMLPHALYGQRSWQEALTSALDEGEVRPVSGGEVAGRPFYVAAILGAPALWAEVREAIRKRQLKLAWLRGQRALGRAFSGQLRFALDGHEARKAQALTLMCPLVSRALTEEQALEAAALDPRGAADAFRLGLNTLLGKWREDPAVTVELCSTGRAWSRGRIPAVLDGEPARLARGAEIRFLSRAFRALAPPRSAEVKQEAVREAERTGAEAAEGAVVAGAAKPA